MELNYRFPNFAKVIIAVLEAKIEPILGEKVIIELREPLRQKELRNSLCEIVKRSETRFLNSFDDRDIVTVMSELPLEDLPSIQTAIISFFDNPTSTDFQNEFIEQLSSVLSPRYPKDKITEASKQYLLLVWEEMTILPELRDRLSAIANIRMQNGVEKINGNLLQIQHQIDKIFAHDPKNKRSLTAETNYSNIASADYPGLIVFLIDVGKGMNTKIYDKPAIEYVNENLSLCIQEIVGRSMRQDVIRPRYRVACFAYSDKIIDLFQKAQPIDEVAEKGLPDLILRNKTSDTYHALSFVGRFVEEYLSKLDSKSMNYSPAPLVCHVISKEYPGQNPEKLARNIMSIRTPDGNVLLENVLIDNESILLPPVAINYWKGVQQINELATSHARQLYRMSSPLPGIYRETINMQIGLHLMPGARMLFPGTTPNMMRVSFALTGVSGASNFNRRRSWEDE